ncbi:hypothetical protein EGW08_010564 [Elysia chlorotica]|uniref:Reverse transcriptase domain-containing protein n=1 Tax=Elysia chlorotica TaxID=188477 RepID=A0A433TJE7_ELYCH|nr:hypothetical protein EGW08_010564 [Elysia chlorotica]
MKAFDSIHRDSLWRIMCAYGIPEKIVCIIKSFFSNFRFRICNRSPIELIARCNQLYMDTIIMQRRLRWQGYVMRKELGNITRTALHWTPEGRSKRGWPLNTWRRTVESELKITKHTWSSMQLLAQTREEWRSFFAALHAMRHNVQDFTHVRGQSMDRVEPQPMVAVYSAKSSYVGVPPSVEIPSSTDPSLASTREDKIWSAGMAVISTVRNMKYVVTYIFYCTRML